MQKFIKSHKKSNKIIWESAPDIQKRLKLIISSLELSWIKPSKIFCMRSYNAKTRAYARIWGLSHIWQIVLKKDANYIIEVISEKYDNLSNFDKDKVLIHELNHIPKNFSGALAPHFRRGKRNFHKKLDVLVSMYLKKF